jgi:hypothetical protein
VLIVVSLFAAISTARVRIQLRHRFPFRFSSIPSVRGRPLLGPSPALLVDYVSTPPLHFFEGKCSAYPFGKKKGAVEYSFCKMDSQCRRELANPRRFVGWCTSGQWLPSSY